MSFFHVLYNVHKKLRSYGVQDAMTVYKGIYNMHYNGAYEKFVEVKRRVLSAWKQKKFISFAAYFERQWIISYRCWIYHTPRWIRYDKQPM